MYATLATPAVCPKRLHHPIIQDQIAACSGGTTFLVTKYIPPAVGYAETSSATFVISSIKHEQSQYSYLPELEMHCAMTEPKNHAHTEAAGPPSDRGLPNVAGTDPNTPRTETA